MSVLLPDQQQLFNVGDRVIRPIDLSRVHFRRGAITEVRMLKASSGVSGTHWFLYHILWDGQTMPVGGYFGSGLEKEP